MARNPIFFCFFFNPPLIHLEIKGFFCTISLPPLKQSVLMGTLQLPLICMVYIFCQYVCFLALWQILCQFFYIYSESPFNFLIGEGLNCKNYPLGIEVMPSLPLKAMLPDRAAMVHLVVFMGHSIFFFEHCNFVWSICQIEDTRKIIEWPQKKLPAEMPISWLLVQLLKCCEACWWWQSCCQDRCIGNVMKCI